MTAGSAGGKVDMGIIRHTETVSGLTAGRTRIPEHGEAF